MVESAAGGLDGPTSTGVEARLSALLCYTAWWLSALVFLLIEQQHRRPVRNGGKDLFARHRIKAATSGRGSQAAGSKE